MLRALVCAAALLFAPMAQAADLDRTRALFADDDGRAWVEGFVEGFLDPWNMLPIEDADALAEAVPRHFNADEIFDEVAARIAAALSDEDLQTLLDWRATPLGARFNAAEIAYEPADCLAPDAACDEVLGRMEIFEDPRLPPIRAVTARQNYAMFDLTILMQVQRAALEAGVSPFGDGPLSPEEIDEVLRQFAADTSASLTRWHLEANAEIYAPFAPEDIAAYAQFLSTDAAQIYRLAAGGALSHALSERARRLAAEFAARGPTLKL